jgi:hypothetical protein
MIQQVEDGLWQPIQMATVLRRASVMHFGVALRQPLIGDG